jgi:PadR family transcriptional regulator, regulatory protein PadR
MDTQLKRGLLEICVLAVLQRADSYGYKIIKDTSSLLAITESTLYPILKRLEQAKFVSVYSVEHNSRLRKYYRITPDGEQRVLDFLVEWDDMMKIYEYIKEGQNNE